MTHRSEDYLVEHYSALGNFEKDFRNKNLFTLVSTFVKGNSIIDIGCGAGFFLRTLKERGKSVVGIEPNEGMRQLATKVIPGAKVLAGGAEDIDTLITTPVDTVTMLDVLEHVEDDEAQIIKIHKALVPNGEFVLVVPAHPFLYGMRDTAMGHYRRYTKDALERLLIENGFSVTSIRYWNALGVLPYAVSEKVLRRPLSVRLREEGGKGMLSELMRSAIDIWMRIFENRFSIGFGLSIICVARKI